MSCKKKRKKKTKFLGFFIFLSISCLWHLIKMCNFVPIIFPSLVSCHTHTHTHKSENCSQQSFFLCGFLLPCSLSIIPCYILNGKCRLVFRFFFFFQIAHPPSTHTVWATKMRSIMTIKSHKCNNFHRLKFKNTSIGKTTTKTTTIQQRKL